MRRVRVTVTLSPRVVKLVDARAKKRSDRSRSAALEEIIEQSETDRLTREYYNDESDQPDETSAADAAFWDEARGKSAALVLRDAKRSRPASRKRS